MRAALRFIGSNLLPFSQARQAPTEYIRYTVVYCRSVRRCTRRRRRQAVGSGLPIVYPDGGRVAVAVRRSGVRFDGRFAFFAHLRARGSFSRRQCVSIYPNRETPSGAFIALFFCKRGRDKKKTPAVRRARGVRRRVNVPCRIYRARSGGRGQGSATGRGQASGRSASGHTQKMYLQGQRVSHVRQASGRRVCNV